MHLYLYIIMYYVYVHVQKLYEVEVRSFAIRRYGHARELEVRSISASAHFENIMVVWIV
jgi:hypothetical protein